MTWQPIETAPRDGSRVLLWTRTDIRSDDIEYVKSICDGEHVRCAQVGRYFIETSEWDKELIGWPTHWMPLPEGPA